MEFLAFRPPGTIKNHNDIIPEVTAGYFIEENLHAITINMWQHQTVESTMEGADYPVK